MRFNLSDEKFLAFYFMRFKVEVEPVHFDFALRFQNLFEMTFMPSLNKLRYYSSPARKWDKVGKMT